MIHRILPHATACIAGDAIILLDVRQDRYFRVPSQSVELMAAWLRDRHTSPPPAVEQLLRANGIARTGDPEYSHAVGETVRIPTDLLSPCWRTAEADARYSSVATAVASTWLSLRLRALQPVLTDHAHVTSPRRPIDSRYLNDRCATFARSRPYSPFPRNCLLDTLSLDRWLGEDARDCRIVFGVTAAPFTAHCWLQSPHTVLNDSYDHVSRYTPILTA
ncbi:lasso peptide biosynthesis B2 protein [Sphingomonas sp. PWP1-2]|uniref:lasso peptide biosynthesis B2 protein n=1 Tax=Sphingomonas sp. PWP1-2 TaxID=2804558 RepID=UPI003CEB4DEC